ncbi:MAG TPA: hypothetical protein DIS62_07505 [Candidatus Kerfeldbacteria bacterium]|nr:MAG: hypothetical protein UY52_C0029G0006 [Parcubacteria group bacterium GW2011_GWC2_49_9]HCJ52359.1 hypothetical protein [Candidatus Kerfeldbacteria bacterium]HCM68798.1 hypothetical protein [Candidatus Kerfeldbacteria bacterium]
MFYCYILQSHKTGSYYVGSCDQLTARLQRHNNGEVRSTKLGVPWKLIYHETFVTRGEARKREKQIKSWKKRLAVKRLFKKTFLGIEDPR